ncbi:MAG TPA: ABC transporter permease [Chthoniobacterales bacterium]|nr:ABC transporter permease [Chthoniobacterales bacterium]
MNDLRFAFRQLIKYPGFTLIAIFALALGIGANTAIFSMVNAVLLRPLPYPEADKLMLVRECSTAFARGSVGYMNWVDWHASQRSFTDLALVRRENFNFSMGSGVGAPERIKGIRVSAGFLSTIGIKPEIGRDLTAAEDLDGAPNVALISDSLWRKHFGASPEVLGKHVVIDGLEREIVGVYPPELQFGRNPDVVIPLGEIVKEEGMQTRDNHQGFSALGRLKPGVTMEQAKSDLNAIAVELEKKYPKSNTGRRVTLSPLFESTVGDYRASLNLLLAAVGCVLLIACANVANLQLARALARSKEMAVRAALGASRWVIARQLLVESTLIALIGALAGVLLTVWSLDAIIALTPANVGRFHEAKIDLSVLAFTTAAAVFAGILVGVWPAWRISHTVSLSNALHEVGGRGGSDSAARQRVRSGLVITQVALAIVLLAGAGLTLKSFWHAQNAPLGFNPQGVVTFPISLPDAKYKKDEQKDAFWNQLLERVKAVPGVEAAAISANSPFDDTEWDSGFHVTGTPPAPLGQKPPAEVSPVSPDYFRVLGMPILRGRNFGPEDLPGEKGHSRSIIIDDSFARKYFPGQDPIGQHIDDNQTLDESAPPMTIVGVVPRTRNESPGEDNSEKLQMVEEYLLASQAPQGANNLHIRTSLTDIAPLIAAVKREVRALDADQPIGAITTMKEAVASSLATRRLTMVLLGAFAFLALVLASVGLYGVMALTVTQRTRELGIRMALGAARANIFRLVLGHGITLVGVGIVVGLLGAVAMGRGLMSLLYNVGALDTGAVIIAIVSLSTVALIACTVPARRATRVDPIIALRTE